MKFRRLARFLRNLTKRFLCRGELFELQSAICERELSSIESGASSMALRRQASALLSFARSATDANTRMASILDWFSWSARRAVSAASRRPSPPGIGCSTASQMA